MRIVNPALCLTAGALMGVAAAGEGEAYKLSHKAHAKWNFVLPAERWHTVSDEIELPGGVSFATEVRGITKLTVDTNGDGIVDKDVRGGGYVTLKGKDENGELVKYSIRIRNIAASKFQWSTGSSMSGTVAGQVVHLFDQDGNGHFDDYGVDALAIGSNKGASLLSKVVHLDGELHDFEVSADGREVTVEPFVGETGRLSVVDGFEAKGKLTAAVFRSGELSFNAAGHKKGLEVPVGRYSFVTGQIEKGSARASMRSGQMRAVEVAAGEEARVEWGGEATGQFSFSQSGDSVTVQPSFAVFGQAGEEYYDFQPRGRGPKIVIKDERRGKTLKEGRFPES